MFYSLSLHGLQHTRLPCPSLSPGVCSNSCPLSRWCHSTISSSVTPFYPLPSIFPRVREGLFQWMAFLHQVAITLELQLQHPSFQWISRVDFLSDWLVWSSLAYPRMEMFLNLTFFSATELRDCKEKGYYFLWNILLK